LYDSGGSNGGVVNSKLQIVNFEENWTIIQSVSLFSHFINVTTNDSWHNPITLTEYSSLKYIFNVHQIITSGGKFNDSTFFWR